MKKISKIKIRKPELLAPAGNLEKMKTAFAFGADAVYAGIPDFSLRTRINDFTLESLAQAVTYAHERKKKVYVTINIFAHNEHLAKLPNYLKSLKKINPDALIVSDPGVIAIIKKHWPEAEIHLSTQANCTNGAAAVFWQQAGVKRVILGREVAYEDILAIKKEAPKLELESFIHGAMCMAYSGRCFLSKYLVDRSGNLGDCVQPCRWHYSAKSQKPKDQRLDNESIIISPDGHDVEFELIEEEHGSYILNSNDMCLMRRMPELMVSGLDSLKIEGRAKSAYYLAVVVGAYRQAIDVLYESKMEAKAQKRFAEKSYKELEDKLVHRGYTEGFMFGQGQLAQNLVNSHNSCAWEFCGQVVSASAGMQLINGKKKLTLVKIHNALRVGDQIEVLLPGCGIIKKKVDKIWDSATGESLASAHGGQGKAVLIDFKKDVPEYSVIRRKTS
ncbi:U32 family peptidase [Candidatus Falkowbacteria bacterium]|nr:U32 family peptidase [Candidatus Falkowbacteria bacterium]